MKVAVHMPRHAIRRKRSSPLELKACILTTAPPLWLATIAPNRRSQPTRGTLVRTTNRTGLLPLGERRMGREPEEERGVEGLPSLNESSTSDPSGS